jgi:hypothetical protein
VSGPACELPDGRSLGRFTVAAVALGLMVLGLVAASARASTLRVTVDPARAGAVIAPRAVGLSFEALDLPQIARGADRGTLTALLSSLRPGLLRFGGASVDGETTYSPAGIPDPEAATTIVPADLDRLARLARRTGWRVLLAVDLGRFNPSSAAAEAADAARRLGDDLAGIEIGNEPNAFAIGGVRGADWSYLAYRDQVRAYRRAIAAAAPGVPIVGPDTVTAGDVDWLRAYAHDERPALLTPHFYPLHRCNGAMPTIADLLGAPVAEGTRRTFAAIAAVGRAAGITVRLGETNNIGCRGLDGVSNTFAASLWAVRYQLAAARAGLAGATFHTLPECAGYSPICGATRADFEAGLLQAMPEWYALLLFDRLEGDRFVHARVGPHPPSLTVDALERPAGRGLDVVAVNAGARAVRLSIGVRSGSGTLGVGRLLALTAPALDARSGVRFAGAAVRPSGAWAPHRAQRRRPARDGRLRVLVPAASAVLVRAPVP